MGGSLPHLLDMMMNTDSETYLGIDPTAGSAAYTWAALDERGHLLVLEAGEQDEVVAYVQQHKPVQVALNAPSQTNQGVVRKRLMHENPGLNPRGADLRLCEYELRERGIHVPPTPSRLEICPAWIQMGINMHAELAKLGYRHNDKANPQQMMEVNSHAIFCSLLQQVPLPKPTLEGRIQRQLVLHEFGVGMVDPMDFFEEITRHRILRGSLPMDYVYSPQELDALAAAFAAWSVKQHPEEVTIIGDVEEGQILLPVSGIIESYR